MPPWRQRACPRRTWGVTTTTSCPAHVGQCRARPPGRPRPKRCAVDARRDGPQSAGNLRRNLQHPLPHVGVEHDDAECVLETGAAQLPVAGVDATHVFERAAVSDSHVWHACAPGDQCRDVGHGGFGVRVQHVQPRTLDDPGHAFDVVREISGEVRVWQVAEQHVAGLVGSWIGHWRPGATQGMTSDRCVCV